MDPRSYILYELEQAREDDRNSHTLTMLTITAAVAAVAFVFSIDNSSDYPLACLIVVICVVFAAFFYIGSIGIENTLRYKYMSFLENEFARLDKAAFSKSPDQNSEGSTEETIQSLESDKLIGWTKLSSFVTTLNPAHLHTSAAKLHFAATAIAVASIAIACLIFLVLFLIKTNNAAITVTVFLLIAPVIVLFFYIARFAMNKADQMYEDALAKVQNNAFTQFDSHFEGMPVKRLILYLIYPRPQDAIKILFIGLGVLMAGVFCFSGHSFFENIPWVLSRLFFGFIVFDFFAYQARYQINDIRGYYEDENNSKSDDRMRLPHPNNGLSESERKDCEKFILSISAGIALWRIVLAVVICFCVGETLAQSVILLLTVVLVFVIAAIYEHIRKAAVPDGASPDVDLLHGRPPLGLLFTVSLGYLLRVVAGFAVSCDVSTKYFVFANDQSLALFVALMLLASYSFGFVFVGITWALEGCHHIESDGNSLKVAQNYRKTHTLRLGHRFAKAHPGANHPLSESRTFFTVWDIGQAITLVLLAISGYCSLQYVFGTVQSIEPMSFCVLWLLLLAAFSFSLIVPKRWLYKALFVVIILIALSQLSLFLTPLIVLHCGYPT